MERHETDGVFTSKEWAESMTLGDMAKALDVSHAAMSQKVDSPRFKAGVRAVDTRPYRRTWHRGDFKKYQRREARLKKALRGE